MKCSASDTHLISNNLSHLYLDCILHLPAEKLVHQITASFQTNFSHYPDYILHFPIGNLVRQTLPPYFKQLFTLPWIVFYIHQQEI